MSPVLFVINPSLGITGFLPDATLNNAYSATLTAFAGRAPYTFAKVSGTLPTGLSFVDNGDGTATISGTPTVTTGTAGASLRFRLKDGDRVQVERTFTLRVVALPLGLSLTLPDATVGEAYAGSVSASGGVSPYTFTKTAGPDWMSVHSTTGAITGTPSLSDVGSAVTVTVRGTDSDSTVAELSDTLDVDYAALIVSGDLDDVDDGDPYTGSLSITGGSGTYTGFDITAGSLPAGMTLTLNGSALEASGTAAEGSYSFTVTVDDDAGNTSAGHVVTVEVTVPSDPHFASVVALLHMDGTVGGSVFTDETAKTWTVEAGNTTESGGKFGQCGRFSGTGRAYTASHADFAFGSGDWTIEFWIKRAAHVDTNPVIIGRRNANADYSPFLIYINSTSHVIGFVASTSGSGWTTNFAGSTAITTSAFAHVAVVRNSGTITLYVDGTSEASGAVSGSLMASTTPLVLGGNFSDNLANYAGDLDDLRITKGVARYTSNFTPPTEPFLDQ